MEDLNGKVAVITGGASGIGLAMAEVFGAEGMKLVIADIQQDALDRSVAALRARGFEAVGVLTDVSKFASVEALAQASYAAFGKVHVLVNNAGVSITGPIWKMSLDDWRWVYDVNFWGIVHGIKAFVPLLIEQGEPAHVVNTASLASFNGTGEHSPYCSSKAAALSISQSLYSELIAWNTKVGVSVVCPGMVDTQIHKSNRNRPEGDQPWSDREWNDPAHVTGSEAFQGRGVPARDIAEATLSAMKENRFYVFNGDVWQDLMRRQSDVLVNAANPPVQTWGPDLRPKPAQ
ncbi:SDR family NAD(P)-dependent oxidoreductase [Phenylobacterium sp.]|uniref:SDR family NAD(P)-dependent oxidoreductase n=1 Tax=Phenylobacterium sp. TaxID=1871053 RepID=UPI00272F0ED8|nr:SDR family NAD(P)-dependent oxidoreductase [Phenylobacterium sp.]MDP1601029.1 SDR family NAD(P)-dependent oxidoreductase [Phenylobacterium sp.]MDP3595331.1 SDR family NAD(P)-dependent oxidoreductase [Phenylobacterium sp.]